MTMTKKQDVFDQIDQLMTEEMNRLVQDAVAATPWTPMHRPKAWRPPTDAYETDAYVVVKMEIAGMKEGDFTITLSSRTLTISGLRRDPAAKLAYQQKEIAYGRFEATVYLPTAVADDEIEATYADGFLKVVMPKARRQRVPVTSTT